VVPLSSIRQPAGVIGRRAVELLLDESFAEDDGSFETDRVLFQPELIVRESTRSGPPR
jgi:LacI family transcriptional regulator